MDRTEPTELTVLCLVHRGDELLLQDRVKADWHGLALPGGHVEPGESVLTAVVREMREETGLTVLHPRLCGVKQFPLEKGRYLVLLFRAEEFCGELTDSAEGKMRWVHRSELPKLPTVPDLDALIRVMLEDELTEFQYLPEGDGFRAVIR